MAAQFASSCLLGVGTELLFMLPNEATVQESVSIDFETANSQRGSACAVGLVRFDAQSQPVNAFSTLLHPHPDCDYFDGYNVAVHGITAEAVRNAPTWPDVAPEVYGMMEDLPVVAHNTGFDGSVLRALSELYGLAIPTNPRLCTLRLARMLLDGQLEHMSLPEVYGHYFPGEEITHHEAYADALACGRIFARMQQDCHFKKMPLSVPFDSPGRHPGPQGGLKAQQQGRTPCATPTGARRGAGLAPRVRHRHAQPRHAGGGAGAHQGAGRPTG